MREEEVREIWTGKRRGVKNKKGGTCAGKSKRHFEKNRRERTTNGRTMIWRRWRMRWRRKKRREKKKRIRKRGGLGE